MKTEITIPVPPEMAELAHRFNAMPTAADRRRAAAALCSVLEAIEGRASEAAPRPVRFKPHPLDCLVLAVVQEGGVVSGADAFAQIEDEKFIRNGAEASASFSVFNRRLRALVDYGAIRRTVGGYTVSDPAKVASVEDVDFGG